MMSIQNFPVESFYWAPTELDSLVDPADSWMDVEFMDMAISANEVDVLAAVATPIPIERALFYGRNSTPSQHGEVIVDPASYWMDVEFMDMPIGDNEVNVLAAVTAPVGIERTSRHRSRPTPS